MGNRCVSDRVRTSFTAREFYYAKAVRKTKDYPYNLVPAMRLNDRAVQLEGSWTDKLDSIEKFKKGHKMKKHKTIRDIRKFLRANDLM